MHKHYKALTFEKYLSFYNKFILQFEKGRAIKKIYTSTWRITWITN